MPVRSQAAEQPSPLRPQSASWCRELGRKRRQLLSPPRAHSPLADASRVLPELWCTCGFSPTPSPRTDELSTSPCSRDTPATGLLPWAPKEPPGCVGGGGGWIAIPAARRGEGEGKGGESTGEHRAGGGTEGDGAFWLCSRFLGEVSTLKLCATGEVTSVSRQGDNGEEGKSWGERVPHFSAQRPRLQPLPRERPASGPRLPAMCPFLLWYWPAWRDIFLGRSPGEGGGGRTAERGQQRPCLPSQVGGSGRTRRARGGGGGAALREGWDGLFSFSSVCPGEGL